MPCGPTARTGAVLALPFDHFYIVKSDSYTYISSRFLDRTLLLVQGKNKEHSMRILTLVLGALIVTLMATQVSAKESREPSAFKTCKIVTGYGTAIGKGRSLNEARENARLKCGTSMVDQYFAQRQAISEDVKDDLALACVNLDCQ